MQINMKILKEFVLSVINLMNKTLSFFSSHGEEGGFHLCKRSLK
jgi:hypothetical protein